MGLRRAGDGHRPGGVRVQGLHPAEFPGQFPVELDDGADGDAGAAVLFPDELARGPREVHVRQFGGVLQRSRRGDPPQGCEGPGRGGCVAGARRAPGVRHALVPRVHRRCGPPVPAPVHRDAARRLPDRIFILTPSIYEIQPDAPGRRARRGRLRPEGRQDHPGRRPVHRKRP